MYLGILSFVIALQCKVAAIMNEVSENIPPLLGCGTANSFSTVAERTGSEQVPLILRESHGPRPKTSFCP